MDWDYFVEINFSELNNDSKEELCGQISDCKIEEDASEEEIRTVFGLAQKLLRFRGVQIEEIKNEHSSTIEKLRQENEELGSQTSSSKNSRKANEARHEAARLSKQNKELLAELEILRKKHKGKDPMLDTEEDDYRAEKEKQKMRKTVELQTEHIASLLSDLEGAEAENASLKQHMSNLRDKLAEATEALAETTSDLTNSQKVNAELKSRVSESRDEVESLRRQISELVDQRSQLDAQLLQFQQAMETRVVTWKNFMDKKDSEISDLKQQLLFSRPEQYTHLQEVVSAVTQSLAVRDQQVNELSSRLEEATKDLEESSEALEKLRSNKGDGESRKLWQQLQRAVKRERALETRIEEAEKDALLRGEQVTVLSTQLQKLEQGEFGLPEALAEARELKRNLAIRDADIARLIKTTNQMQASLDELADQNLALRERFGVTEEEIDVSGVRDRRASERQRIESLLKQVANLEQEKVSLKLQLREAKKGKFIADNDEEAPPNDSEQFDVKLVIEENESLRKGMHEILESIRHQDASSDIHLESNCLERLLEALDARHVAGWYHPAMRLQAQLHTVQGVATELREQLRIAREQEREWKQQVGLALERGEGMRAAVADEGDSRQKIRTYIPKERQAQSSDWSNSMRKIQAELGGLFKEVSKSLPLIADVRREREDELAAQISDLEASIDEYKRHLDEQKEHSIAVCAAKCATQRIAERSALRKCHSLEAARKNLTERLEKESVESVEREATLGLEIAAYREKEIALQNKINKLTNILDRCVPMEEYKQTQQELANATEALRNTLLAKSDKDQESSIVMDLKEKVKYFESKVETLVEELEKDKASLRIMEVQSQFPDTDEQLAALGQKLSALEISESTVIKKAEHAEKMYQLAKAQVIELEREKREMEQWLLKQFSIKDTELVISAIRQFPETQDEAGKVAKLESELKVARQEIDSLKNIINSRNVEMDTIRDLNQQLQSSGDLQATLGRITEDVLSLRLELENIRFKLQESERTVNEEKNKNKKLEATLKALHGERFDSAIVLHSREKIYKRKLLSICSRHTSCVPLSTFELATKWLATTRSELDAIQAAKTDLETKVVDLETELSKFKIVQSTIDDLQTGSQNDQLQEWQSRVLQLRIKELESSRKAEQFEKECSDLKCQVVNLKTRSRTLEDERLELEKNWEQRLMNLEFEKAMTGEGKIKSDEPSKEQEIVIEELDTPQKSEEKPSPAAHPTKKLIRRGTYTSLHDNTDVLKQELQSKEERIAHLERMLDGQQGDSRAKLALEAMVASLSELVSLKEAAVVRARQRLKEAHDEHSEVAKELRRQLFELQNSIAKLEGRKAKEQLAPEASQGPTVTKLLTQLHTVEDELRVSNHSAGTLAGQLRTLSSELQRWKDLAEARQTKLQALQDRFEEEISQAIAGRFATRIAEKAETEASEKELTSARSNIELARSRQEVENLREMVANMQDQIKTLQGKVNERRRRSQSFSMERPEKLTSDPVPKVVEKPAMQPRFDNIKVASIISKLQSQVKQLQEEIESYKSREQLFLDQSKAKTNEVVSRWEERKKLQAKCDKLKQKLDESEAACKKLKESNLALRTLIERLEREKIVLETQLRKKTRAVTIAATPVPAEAQLAKLRTKLAANEEECASLRRQLEHHKRVAEDVPRFRAELSTLRGKYKTQREAAVQMQSKIARLEATNLELNLKIDDLRSTSRNTDRGDDSDEGMSREELQRSVLMLGQHVRKLQEKLRNAREGSGDSAAAEASQKLHAALRRKLSLENEVSQLKQERADLTAQLHQKVKILVEVRAALQEASLREAALKSEIASLRRMQ